MKCLKGAWIDGIKGKFKRGRRTVTSYADAAQALGDDELAENRLASSHKRSRHEFEGDSDDGHFESGEMQITNVRGKDLVNRILILKSSFYFVF